MVLEASKVKAIRRKVTTLCKQVNVGRNIKTLANKKVSTCKERNILSASDDTIIAASCIYTAAVLSELDQEVLNRIKDKFGMKYHISEEVLQRNYELINPSEKR